VVKSGDTLVSIAHRTGVPVSHILALNPDVDPQILIAGQTLQLR
jgi:LysM repeat protein